MGLQIGDIVESPRFLKIRIGRIISDRREAKSAGYTQPTYCNDTVYDVRGKFVGSDGIEFAAIRR